MKTHVRLGANLVPFELIGNLAYVDAYLGKSRPLRMILETGAVRTVLDSTTAHQLGVRIIGQAGASGAGAAVVTVQIGEVSELRVGSLRFQRLEPILQPLTMFSQRTGERVDGLLGVDALSRFVVELDYAARRLVLHDSTSFEYAGPGATLSMRLECGLIHFPATVSDIEGVKATGEFVLDTGAAGEMGVFLSAPFGRDHGIPAEGQPLLHAPRSGLGVGGTASGDLCRLRALQIGPFRLEEPTAFVSFDDGGFLGQAGRAGLVGTEVLRRFRVFIDYGRARLILEQNEHFGEPFESRLNGLNLVADGEALDTVRVQSIVPGSPASEAGFEVGDVLASVGGRWLAGMRMSEVRALLKQGDDSLEIGVRRGAETLRLGMSLKPTL